MTRRIAMWSGPRNISTAMMRSFENRSDTVVIDEPFYAFYLVATGIDHPMREAVISNQETNWRLIVSTLTEQSRNEAIFYQKHMTHHMLPELDLGWTNNVSNCFLIRDPEYVVASYARKRESVTEQDIGIRRQFDLYQEISDITGQSIPVIDARQFLLAPEAHLRLLCAEFKIPFTSDMLSWPRGPRSSDGVWASHWYENVEQSTCFEPFRRPVIDLTTEQRSVADKAQPYYEQLLRFCSFS